MFRVGSRSCRRWSEKKSTDERTVAGDLDGTYVLCEAHGPDKCQSRSQAPAAASLELRQHRYIKLVQGCGEIEGKLATAESV